MAILLAASASLLLSVRLWPSIESPIRHVDPKSEVERLPLSIHMMSMIKSMFDSLIRGDYVAFKEDLKAFMEAHVPDKYKFIVERFNQLLNRTSELLAEVEDLLEEAERLLNKGEDARAMLSEASIKLAYANITYIELKSASEELARGFSLPFSELREKLNEIAKIIELLNERIKELMESLERQEMLKEAFIVMDVEPKRVWTGGIVSVEGRLYGEDGGLVGRTVEIYVDGVKIAEAITVEDGRFKAQFKLPYIYKPRVFVQAFHSAKGDLYKPSASNVVGIELIYVKPDIVVEAMGEALPGRSFSIMGRVEAECPLPYDFVRISWCGRDIATPLSEGRFASSIKVPEDLEEGTHQLIIEVPGREICAPAREVVYVNVKRIPLKASVSLPSMAIAGTPFSVKVESEEKVNVKAIFAGQSYASNSSQELIIWTPLNLFTAYYDLEVLISSPFPWYRATTFNKSVFVVNPIALMLPIGLAFGFASRLRRAKKIAEEIPREGIAASEERLDKRFAPSSFRWLVELYWRAVDVISRLTGTIMKPSTTMREYLMAVKSSRFWSCFKALTLAAEKAVYSKGPSEEEVRSAKEAFHELNEN